MRITNYHIFIKIFEVYAYVKLFCGKNYSNITRFYLAFIAVKVYWNHL
jgi:hypothetical protein